MTINSLHDHQVLQEDLLNLTKWASDWKIDFNVTKCHLLCITKKREPSNFIYTANSNALTRVPEWDFLGVTCIETLRWGAHCSKIAAKANKSLGLIRGWLRPCSVEVKEKSYLTLVRPTLKYFSSSWNHYTDTDKTPWTNSEECGSLFVCNDYNIATSTSSHFKSLGWDTLEHRR